MRSSRRTPRPNRASNSSAKGHPANATPVQELFVNTMKSIPEREQSHGSGVEDFLNGMVTPSRTRRTKARSSGKTTSRRLATPTQSKTKSKLTTEDGKCSDDTSYTRSGVNENDGYSNNGQSSSKSHYSYSKTPKHKMKDRSSHNEKEYYTLSPKSPTEIVLSPAKKLVAAAKNVASSRKQKHTVRKVVKVDASTQTDGEEEVFSINLNNPLTRSLQNRQTGNLDRAYLGTGDLKVFKCTSSDGNGDRLVCRFIDDGGNLKFEAELPNSKDANRHMHLNTGVENSIEWYAYDTSRTSSAMRRAFYISFNDGAEMFATLLQFYGGKNIDIVKEFMSEGSRFVLEKEILPPHSIVKNENDMDVNSDDEEYAAPPLSKEEEVEKYGYINVVSQAF